MLYNQFPQPKISMYDWCYRDGDGDRRCGLKSLYDVKRYHKNDKKYLNKSTHD